MAGFDPSLHPRALDGKFGAGTVARAAIRTAGQRASSAKQVAARALNQRSSRVSKMEAPNVDAEFGITMHKMGGAALKSTSPQSHQAAPAERAATTPEAISARTVMATDRRREIVAHGIVDNPEPKPGLANRQLSEDAQNALRGHHNQVLQSYGLPVQDESLRRNGNIEIRTVGGMGRARGVYFHDDGTIALSQRGLDNITAHAKIDGRELPKLGRDMMSSLDDPSSEAGRHARGLIETYHVSTHEAIHNHGPTLEHHFSQNMLEEMTTEMAARRVTSDIHGIPIEHVPGSYQRYIDPTVDELRSVASRAGVPGVTASQTHEALAHAAMQFKSQSNKMLDPSIELYRVGKMALEKLGVHNIEANRLLHNNLLSIAQDL